MVPEAAPAPAPAPRPNEGPVRQGFVGYVYVGALKWRVMLRLHPVVDGWRGRLWFSQAGGAEVWDTEEFAGESAEALLRRARLLSAEELIRRCRSSAGERRRYFALRAVTDDLLAQVRALNRVAVGASGRACACWWTGSATSPGGLRRPCAAACRAGSRSGRRPGSWRYTTSTAAARLPRERSP